MPKKFLLEAHTVFAHLPIPVAAAGWNIFANALKANKMFVSAVLGSGVGHESLQPDTNRRFVTRASAVSGEATSAGAYAAINRTRSITLIGLGVRIAAA